MEEHSSCRLLQQQPWRSPPAAELSPGASDTSGCCFSITLLRLSCKVFSFLLWREPAGWQHQQGPAIMWTAPILWLGMCCAQCHPDLKAEPRSPESLFSALATKPLKPHCLCFVATGILGFIMAWQQQKNHKQLPNGVSLSVFGGHRRFSLCLADSLLLTSTILPELILPLEQLMTMNLNKGWLHIIKACWLMSYTPVLVFLINGLIKQKHLGDFISSRFFSRLCLISNTSYGYTL